MSSRTKGAARSRILIVEDEALIAMDLARRIESLGYEVVGTADNRDDALDLTRECIPNLVLMDINIIGPVDGIEVAQELRSHWDIPVVFLTAFGDDATVERAKAVTPYGYLLKPFDERTLRTTLEVTLHRHVADKQMRLLSTAVDTATNGIIVVDAHDERRSITYCNRAFVTMTGYSEAQTIGQPADFLVSEDSPGDALPRLQAALRERVAFQTEVLVRRQEGTTFWSEIRISPVSDIAGEITHLLVFNIDITARRNTEAALVEAQKLDVVGRLTAGIAHDFNNVLAVIQAFAEFVQEDLAEDDPRHADLNEVISASERGAALTRQLLGFVHRSGGTPRHVDINRVLGGSTRMLQRLVGVTVRVEVRLCPQPLVVLADPISIEQILLNLAANARDAMASGGTLTLTLSYIEGERGRHMVRLEARDTGSGMTTDTRQRIFEPFFTTKPTGTGTGLGLATTKAVIDQIGGTIRVESGLGEGTLFIIDMPLSGEVDSEIEPDQDTFDLRDAGGALVLIAEANAGLREASSRALTQAGFQVVTVADGERAVARLDELGTKIELFICDIVLPRIGGQEVIAHAKQTNPRASVLATAGYLDGQYDLAAEASTFLWKPFSMTSLVRRSLEALTDSPHEPRALSESAKVEPVIASVAPSPHTPSRLESPATLLVEDEDDLRSVLARNLEQAGYRVVSVGTGDAAIAELGASEFDLVVADIDLPGANGFAVMKAAQRDSRQTPVLLMTGSPSVESARTALYDKAAGYLVKPFGMKEFTAEVERVMAETEVATLQRYLRMTRYGVPAVPERREDGFRVTWNGMMDLVIDDPANTAHQFGIALESLHTVYQPIVRAQDRSLFAYEAFIRTRHSTLTHPIQILTAAELLGRTKELGRAVRQCVAMTLQRHPERLEPIFLSLHPSELDSSILCTENDPLYRFASRVIFEVTDRGASSNTEILEEELPKLRSSGYRIALDNLGEGYAGLSWPAQLQPEAAKIDVSMVRDIHESKLKREVVRSLVAVCRRSRITLVAEGVEALREAQVLCDLGCDLLQGNFFARPGPAFPELGAQ